VNNSQESSSGIAAINATIAGAVRVDVTRRSPVSEVPLSSILQQAVTNVKTIDSLPELHISFIDNPPGEKGGGI